MAEKKTSKRTKQIKIRATPANEHFQLGVQIPHAIGEQSESKVPPHAAHNTGGWQHTSKSPPTRTPRAALELKIWNTLEWLATSALIFTVVFFAVNFNAYSILFLDKLNQLRGTVQTNPLILNITHPAGVTQQPLPIAVPTDQSKKQIPYLDIQIAPPDDRIVIPRINKNVSQA